MNIFTYDRDIENHSQNVQGYIDAHIKKMPLETVQLISSVCHVYDIIPCNNKQGNPYGRGYINHPCAKWMAQSLENVLWAMGLLEALCNEYVHRFGKEHDSRRCYYELLDKIFNIPESKFTEPIPACGPLINYLNTDLISKYRIHWVLDKRLMAKWTKRSQPEWILSAISDSYTDKLIKQLYQEHGCTVFPGRLKYKRTPVSIEYKDFSLFVKDALYGNLNHQ